MKSPDFIGYEAAGTIPALFEMRVKADPDKPAFRQFDEVKNVWFDKTWSEMNQDVSCWQGALENEGFKPGDRMGLMVRNSMEWAHCDLAALGSGLVTVPIFIKESHENIVHIVNDAQLRLLVVEDSALWDSMEPIHDRMPTVQRVLIVRRFAGGAKDPRVKYYEDWLCTDRSGIYVHDTTPDSPASIVYTSGTTGMPKGVVLTHRNILWNAWAGLHVAYITRDDLFLSFLPLTHMFERTVGYYLPMMVGAKVVYARNVRTVAEDMLTQRPTVIVSVPLVFQRIYERVLTEVGKAPAVKQAIFGLARSIGYDAFLHEQGRGPWKPSLLLNPALRAIVGKKILAKMGGRLRLAVSGGAALPLDIWNLFAGIGFTIIQGYGMTEASPVISCNSMEDNHGETVGPPLRDVTIKVGEHGELLAKSPGVMIGYWNNEEATRAIIDGDGWLHTGDIVEIINGHIKIVDRLKQIIVMSNGEKVPPERVEGALRGLGLFENLMVVGEKRPFLALLAKPIPEKMREFAAAAGFPYEGDMPPNDPVLYQKIMDELNAHLTAFPGYVRVKRLVLVPEQWLPDNGLLTNKLSLKRKVIAERYKAELDAAFAS